MRTTVTLDDDVQAEAEALRRTDNLSLSQAVNALARAGLTRRNAPAPARFHQRTHRLGLRVDVTNVAEALDLLDGSDQP